jgi:TolB-like protein
MRVLVYLASHPGEVVTKEQLVEEVWDGAFVTDEALTYSIWELRKALGDDAKKPRFIQTVPKQGYCLIAPVSFQSVDEKKSWWVWLAAVVLVVLAAVLVLRQFRSPPAVSVSPNVVAVLPFEVRGSERISYLGEGMVDLLSMKLEGAGDLHSVDARALLGVVAHQQISSPAPEQGRQITEQFGAGFFVLGSIVEAGGTVQFNASLYTSDGELKARAEAAARSESQIPDRVDDLAIQLLSG